MVSTVKSELDGCDDAPRVVVTGKGRQFHFSIYKWPNKGVPVVIWGSSRLSSMSKAEETTLNDPPSTSVEKAGKDEEKDGESSLFGLKEEKKTSLKRPGVQTKEEKVEIDSISEQTFFGVSKAREANVKPLHSIDSVSEQAFFGVSKAREANVKPLHSTDSMSEQTFSGPSKAHEATVKPLHSIFHENDERQGWFLQTYVCYIWLG